MKKLLPRTICIILAMFIVIAMSAYARGNSLKAGNEADGYESDGTEQVTTTISGDEIPVEEAELAEEKSEAVGAEGDTGLYKVTMIYMYEEDNSEAAPSETYEFSEGESVKIMFPRIDGYTAVLAAIQEPCDGVSFTMGATDVEIVVYYVAEETGDVPEKDDPTVSEDKIKIREKTDSGKGSGHGKSDGGDSGDDGSSSGGQTGQVTGGSEPGVAGGGDGSSDNQGTVISAGDENTSDENGSANREDGSAGSSDSSKSDADTAQAEDAEGAAEDNSGSDDSDKKIAEIKINDDGTYELAVIADDETPLAAVEGPSHTHIWMYIVLGAMILLLGAYGVLKFRDKKQN